MKIIHEFWDCPNCGNPVEITDEAREDDRMYCDACGYEMEFNDFRFESREEEY